MLNHTVEGHEKDHSADHTRRNQHDFFQRIVEEYQQMKRLVKENAGKLACNGFL